MLTQLDFTLKRLGECTIQSPMKGVHFTDDQEHILFHKDLGTIKSYMDKGDDPPKFEAAGPREKIFFDPANLARRDGRQDRNDCRILE